jgi:hypothetical protein
MPARPSAMSRTSPETAICASTRRYDHTRDALERSAAYTIAGWFG